MIPSESVRTQRSVVKGLQDRPFRGTNIVFPYVGYSSYGAEKIESLIVPQATLGRQQSPITNVRISKAMINPQVPESITTSTTRQETVLW